MPAFRFPVLRLPQGAQSAVLRNHISPSRFFLSVSVAGQSMSLFERNTQQNRSARIPAYLFRKSYRISTSRFGIGQVIDSNQTPLGLHRVARKIGGGHPVGTVFKSRQPLGLTWAGMANAAIVHRILWLEGLETGLNSGGEVDTFRRYIYIHGYGDEMTLGQPQSCGCIHMAGTDLIPLYDRLPVFTLVWVDRR